MNVSLRQLQAFSAVAELGSFTRAAERLRVGQPSISLLVKELEAELGLALIHRTTRRTEVTDAGKEFLERARALIRGLEEAVGSMKDLASLNRGRLTIGAPPLLAAALLPEVMVRFGAKYPEVRLVLVDAPINDIVPRMHAGEIDIGVGTFVVPALGFGRQILVSDALVLHCRADHPLADQANVGWAHLGAHPCIALPANNGIRIQVAEGFRRAGQQLVPVYEVNEIRTIMAFVEAGLGFTVLPRLALRLGSERIVDRTLNDFEVVRDVSAIWRSDRALPPAAMPFITELRKAAQDLGREIQHGL